MPFCQALTNQEKEVYTMMFFIDFYNLLGLIEI
jgi:hypothetical protein